MKKNWVVFKEYYLKYVIIGVVIVIAIGCAAREIIQSNKGNEVVVDIIGSQLGDAQVEQLTKEIEKAVGWDTKGESLRIDASLNFDLETTSEYSYASQSKLVASVAANSLDVIVMEKDVFDKYEQEGYFTSLQQLLPEEQIEQLESYGLLGTVPDVSQGELCGISLKTFANFEKLQTGMKNPVIAIVANSKKKESAVQLVQYFTIGGQ